jgi:hypothetical protein
MATIPGLVDPTILPRRASADSPKNCVARVLRFGARTVPDKDGT